MQRSVVLLAATLSGASSLALANEPIRIGVIASYSGAYADYGRQINNGIALYLKENNSLLAGKPVTLIRKDTSGADPALAARHARELATVDKVAAIVGLDFSPNALAIAPIATQAKLPVIVMNAAAAAIPAKSPYIARVSFTVSQVSAPMGDWAAAQGLKNAVTLVADYGPGMDAEKAFTERFKAAGGSVTESLRAPLSNPDFAPFVQKIKDLKPQAAFFFLPSGEQPTALLKVWQERGLEAAGVKLIATGEATDDSFLPSQGDLALGLVTTHHYSYAHPSDANRRYVAAYEAEFGKSLRPSYMSVAAYDGMNALGKALEKTSGSLDGDKIMEALRGLTFESPRGPIMIDAETRDIVQTVYVRKVEKIDGQLVNREFERFDAVR
ncbi:ABC transporter substrate-binding protein [Lacibacterium aquatile]|uniref:ABC transporter substrate-binding protein n=1 Tax=Lacibacterium aquatile TaxID=1168082 RepID=A0ABW5DTP6_9PROT